MIDVTYEKIHNLYEMSRIGNFNGDEVCLYGGEGNIPHIHIKDKQTEKECCIRLDVPEYFEHGDRKFFKLNSKGKKDFIEWLNSMYYKKKLNVTNWEYITTLWNINNPDNEIPEDPKMPDYTKLK